MERYDKDLLRIFLAALLMLAGNKLLILGTLIAALALAASYFFKLLQPLFPKKFFRAAVILSTAVLFQIGFSLNSRFGFGVSPGWIVSFWLLLDWRDHEPKSLVSLPIPAAIRVLIFEALILICGVGEIFFPPSAASGLGLLVISMIIIGLFREVWVAAVLKMKKGRSV